MERPAGGQWLSYRSSVVPPLVFLLIFSLGELAGVVHVCHPSPAHRYPSQPYILSILIR